VTLIVLATYGVSRLVRAQTEAPEIEMPPWTFRTLPEQIGNWRGEEARLDPEIAMATGAEVLVNRNYRDAQGHTITLHTAMFKNPASGITHTPSICYRVAGWKIRSQSFENIQVSNDLAIPVKFTVWDREGESLLVACWYQLGNIVLYERLDMAGVRWQLRGRPTWPVLTKVMLQIPAADLDNARTSLTGFTEQIVKWLNQPEHRKYLDRWPGA
jgi:EpsI family protein